MKAMMILLIAILQHSAHCQKITLLFSDARSAAEASRLILSRHFLAISACRRHAALPTVSAQRRHDDTDAFLGAVPRHAGLRARRQCRGRMRYSRAQSEDHRPETAFAAVIVTSATWMTAEQAPWP